MADGDVSEEKEDSAPEEDAENSADGEAAESDEDVEPSEENEDDEADLADEPAELADGTAGTEAAADIPTETAAETESPADTTS